MWKTPAFVSCLFLVGCACTQGPAPAPGSPPPVASVETPPPPPAATTPPPALPALEGTWSSASCGARKYERRIVLNGDGTFTAQDRVSPCPPGVTCVWSGIVDRQGTWSKKDNVVTLKASGEPGPKPGAADFPLELTVDPKTGALAETQDGSSCVYRR